MSEESFLIAACDHCGGHIEFPAHGVGAKVACPHCANETVLVEESHDTTVPQEEITASELQAALQSPVSRRRISLFYQTGLLLVAVFMVLLPLAYIAFATLVGYCVYWYAVHAPGFLFSSLSGGVHVMIFRTIAYIGPLIAGGVAVFFMFKPLIARRRKRAEVMELNPSQHPRLYQFIVF